MISRSGQTQHRYQTHHEIFCKAMFLVRKILLFVPQIWSRRANKILEVFSVLLGKQRKYILPYRENPHF